MIRKRIPTIPYRLENAEKEALLSQLRLLRPKLKDGEPELMMLFSTTRRLAPSLTTTMENIMI